MKKQKPVAEKEQAIVADILNRFCFVKTIDDLTTKIQEVAKRYRLCDDPFTGMYCTSKEYAEYSLEYERQLMFEKYWHYDGLD